jgi:hypothetical protein
MAGQFDVHYVSANIGLTAGTTMRPFFKNITENGGITILSCNANAGGAGTVTANLIYTDATGGTSQGTIAALGSASQVYAAAGTAALLVAGVIASAFVPPNKCVGVELGAGTAGSNTIVSLAYLKGQ